MKLKWTAALLGILMILTIPALMVCAEETSSGETYILSETLDAFPASMGFSNNGSAHGNNQTRLLVTESGIYVTCPFGSFQDEDGTGAFAGLWKVSEDGTVRLLFQDKIYNVAAGTSTNGWVDKDGHIWVGSFWEIGSGFIELRLWEYNPAADTVSDYPIRGYSARGSKFGKPCMVYDASSDRIYSFSHGGDSGTAYFAWFIFDVSTKTWEKTAHYFKSTTGVTDYHYAYPDGRGGFFCVNENCFSNQQMPSDIPGMSVYDALQTFRSCRQDAGFIWQTAHMIYIPNVEENKGYNIELLPAEFDVKNGLYPNDYNVYNDLFLDETTGYLYSTVTLLDANGIPGVQKILCIYDTHQPNEDIQKDGPFKKLVQKNMIFLGGLNETYTQHVYRDTEGNLYYVAMSEAHGEVEIWKFSDELCSDIRLVWTEKVRGFVNFETGGDIYSTIPATNRGGSRTGDKLSMIAWTDLARTWYYFTIDFATLRSALASR